MGRPTRQTLALLAVSVVVGFGANALRPEPLPLTGELGPPPEPEAGSDLGVTAPEEALARWEEGAFFVDVRSRSEWEQRRISGSFSVPADGFEDHYFELVADFDPAIPLVVYGAGPLDEFDVRRVAAGLLEFGHLEVVIVVSGAEELVAVGLAPAEGPEEAMP